MARATGDHHAASLGQKTMTHTIQCPECGVVLNVPDSAAGRKLKCPKCATKFSAPKLGPAESAIAEASPASTLFPTRKDPLSSGDFDAIPRAGSSGSIELPTSNPKKGSSSSSGHFDLPASKPKKGPSSSGGIDLPSSPGPLRDTFDLPLLDDAPPLKGPAKGPAAADPAALFLDEPKSNRKPKGAEARAKARRCPDCGGVVGVGMSLCNTCGLDLDTGQRITPVDVFDDEMPVAHRAEVPPLGVLFVGSIAAMTNLMLAIATFVGYASGQGAGLLCLMVVWTFGIYASVQFLRRKAIRPMFLALGLAVAIGAVYLIAMPIIKANMVDDIVAIDPNGPNPQADPDAPVIKNLRESLDMNKITSGVALLLAYAALSVYLNSPGIKREFHKK